LRKKDSQGKSLQLRFNHKGHKEAAKAQRYDGNGIEFYLPGAYAGAAYDAGINAKGKWIQAD